MRKAIERAKTVDWWTHLIATSDRYNDSLHTIETMWSVRQLTQAHLVLDVWGEVQKAHRRKLKKKLKRAKT